jgi:hypothetical protein
MLVGRNSESKKKGFSDIRSNHRLRNEFRFLNIPHRLAERFPVLEKLGLKEE